MQRMVDALSLVVSVSSIPIHVLFRFAKMEEGLAKSAILEYQKHLKEMNETLPPEYQKALQKNNRRGTLVEKKMCKLS